VLRRTLRPSCPAQESPIGGAAEREHDTAQCLQLFALKVDLDAKGLDQRPQGDEVVVGAERRDCAHTDKTSFRSCRYALHS
jgi:hypothetical protein